MNKILSIIAICAILGVVASQSTTAWNATEVISATELAANFNLATIARYSDNSRVVVLGFNFNAANTSNITITRRYLNTTFGKYDTKAADDQYVNLNMRYCDFMSGNVRMAWSQNGYYAVICGGANVYGYVFKTNGVLNSSGVIVESSALATALPAGTVYSINEAYFQDDYFYTSFKSNASTPAIYLNGFQAKAPTTLLASSPSQINSDAIVAATTFDCDQRPKSTNVSYCAFTDGSASKARQLGFSGSQSAAVYSINTNRNSQNIVVPAKNYYATLSQAPATPVSQIVTVVYDNTTNATSSITLAASPSTGYTFYKAAQYFENDFFVVYSTNNTDATGAVTSQNLIASIIQRNTSTSNYTNTFGTIKYFADVFTLQDQSCYVWFMNTNGGFSIGQIFNQTTATKFGSALQTAIASIFVVGALLFAF